MMFLSFRSFCFLRLTLGMTGLRQMGITAHVLILPGAAIDHNPLLFVVPLLLSDDWENGRGFREECSCEDRFVGVMERRRGRCDAVELDDELFGRHRDAGAARRRQTELQVV